MTTGSVRRGERFRRADTVVVYWRAGRLIASNYLARRDTPATPALLAVLDALGDWMSAAELAAASPALGPVRHVRRLLDQLAGRRLVRRRSRPLADDDAGPWATWHPHAAFFHFGTANGTFRPDPENYFAELTDKAVHTPAPPPAKAGRPRSRALPPARPLGQLTRALTSRRTWRRFGSARLTPAQLATLLGWTFGAQALGDVPGQGDVLVKTSPSGGARHPIEAYVVALNVAGLPAGSLHHYDAARHALARLPGRLSRRAVPALLGHQRWFAGAAVLVVMAPVFARTMWRYPASHAYRAVLIEAGHLCQTWCLIASALRLAPFCTIALAERRWDALLGLDGISETPIYVAGVGARPNDRWPAGWLSDQPQPHGSRTP